MPQDQVKVKQEDVSNESKFIIVEIGPQIDPEKRIKEEPKWDENDSESCADPKADLADVKLPENTQDGYNVTVEVECVKEEPPEIEESISDNADEAEEPENANSASEVASDHSEILECDICRITFDDASSLATHASVHKAKKTNSAAKRKTTKKVKRKNVSEGNYECHTCGKKFTVKGWLKKHLLKPHTRKVFPCSVCHKEFPYQCKLTAHELLHTGEKPYACKHCKKRFASKCNLVSHERVHTGNFKNIVSCDICQRKFTQKQHLDSHRRSHTGEKPYTCEFCHKRFSQKQHLKTHVLIHTGEKPYACKVCDKRFKRASDIRRHERIHTGDKPYSCKLCNKKFIQKQHVTDHIIYNRCIARRGPEVRALPS